MDCPDPDGDLQFFRGGRYLLVAAERFSPMPYTQELVGFGLMFYEYSYFVLILDKLYGFYVSGGTTCIDVAGQVLMRFTSAIMIKSGGGRNMTTKGFGKCWFWKVFRPV